MTAYIPCNLDLTKFLQDNPPAFRYHIDKFRYIISLITEIPAFNKDILDKYAYVPIQAKMLQDRIHNYRQYLDYLLQHEILETDNHWVKDKECIGYRFTPQYHTPVKPETISLYTLVKNVDSRTKFEQRMEKKYAHLRRWFNDGLQIDYEAAIDYLYSQFKYNTKAGVENALQKFNANCVCAYRLKKHDYIFTVDDNVGRLHTNLTTMKKELRNFLTYEGKPMVSVDYANSQPCLTSVFMDERFYTLPSAEPENPGLKPNNTFLSVYNLSKPVSTFLPFTSSYSIQDILSYIMIVKSEESLTGIGFQGFIDCVCKGELYPFIQQEVKARTGVDITNKKKLKAVVFTAFFTDNRFIGQPEAEPKRIFRDLFPEVYKVYAKIKRGDSTILPRLLQTIESKLMLDRVAERIRTEYPKMVIYTIHDSIACLVGNEHYVARVMKEEMQKAIGVTPTVRFEYWKPENAYKEADLTPEPKESTAEPMRGVIGL